MSRAIKQYQIKSPQNNDSKAQTQSRPTTDSIADSNNSRRKKRGFSLCKQLAVNFDRIYLQRDLAVQKQTGVVSPNQAHLQQSLPTRATSKKKFLKSLQSVKSEKSLFPPSASESIHREKIQIGRSRINSRNNLPKPENSEYCPTQDFQSKSNQHQSQPNLLLFEDHPYKIIKKQPTNYQKNNEVHEYNLNSYNYQKKYAHISEYSTKNRR